MLEEIDSLEELWVSLDDVYEKLLVDERVSKVVRGPYVAHRFALVTQLAGAFLDPARNVMALQTGSDIPGSWDPRSFASKVVVPWLRNHRSPLGNSGDPYVSNPLRRTTISDAPEGVKKSSLPYWKYLHDLLTEVSNDSCKVETMLRQAVSVVRRMVDEQDRPLVLPERVSPQAVIEAVDRFLSEPSGGDRGTAVVAAIFTTLLAPLLGIHKVSRLAVNASDESSGSPGDIICTDAKNEILLVIEVKERSLTFEDVRSSLAKVSETPLGKFVFAAPQLERVDSARIVRSAETEFARHKRSLHFVPIVGLLSVSLMMHTEEKNVQILREVENSLTIYNTQPSNRTTWRDIVTDLT